MRKIFPYLLLSAICCFPLHAQLTALLEQEFTARSEDQRLDTLYRDYWNFLMKEFPERGISLGYPGCKGWEDLSLESIQKKHEAFQSFAEELKTIDYEDLSEDKQLDYSILKWELEMKVQSSQYPQEFLLINAFRGLHIQIPQTLLNLPKETLAQAEDLLNQLKAIPHVIDQAIILLINGLDKGITPPKVILRNVPLQIANLLTTNPNNCALFLPFTQLSENISEEQRCAIKQKAFEILIYDVYPAFNQLKEYLVSMYIPNCRESTGLSDLPRGKEWYRCAVKVHTSTDLTPEEIHAKGLEEVKRIHSEMDIILEEVGFKDQFEQFVKYLHTDKQFFFDDRESILEGYRDIIDTIQQQLTSLFGKLPSHLLEVVPVPAFAEAGQIAAYYRPGSADFTRPGYFFINTYNPKNRPKWEMETLALHESLPGHHLQFSLAQQLDHLCDFRRYSFITSFIEGWGLYSEGLGEQLGLYRDPYSKFGRLTYEIFRATRLVVDTGLHYFGWTRQQAIDYMCQTTGMNEQEVTLEVDRYLIMPGQALAYKIGELKILEWLQFAKNKQGEQFDIKAFHDELLSYGSAVPLGILEKEMHRWATQNSD